MIDFTKSNVFKREQARKQTFLRDKLLTAEEEQSKIDMGDDDDDFGGLVDMGDMLGGSGFDLGGDFGDFGDFGDSFGDSFGGSSGKRGEIANDNSYQTGVWWKDILYSPWFLFLYVGKLLVYSFPNREERKGIIEALSKISLISAATSGILYLIGFKFIITLSFQFFSSMLMLLGSHALLKYVYNKEETQGETEGTEDGFGDFGDFGSMDIGGDGLDSFGEGFSEGAVGGFGSGVGLNFSEEDDDIDIFGGESDDSYEEYESEEPKVEILPPSPIDISSTKKFDRTLLKVFRDNTTYQGEEISDRAEILRSMSGYIVTNDKRFGKWETVKERGLEYENIAYALFKGLSQITTSFGSDEEYMVIHEIKKNPLLYRIEVELPSYFKQGTIRNRIHEIEDNIKRDDEDTDVEVHLSYFMGKFVFKFMRLDNRNLISYGDILRYYDEDKETTPLEEFKNHKRGLPLLLGLRNMEYPYFVDLEDNTSGVIAGGSGSGKSWLTFLLFINVITSNDYNNVHFVILDKKNAPFWNQFAKFPHVLGYHYKPETYLDIVREMREEVDRRKELLNELNAENFKGLRETMRKNGDYEGLKKVPLLLIVVDEITSTMQYLKEHYGDENKELYDSFRNTLNQITQEGRSLGVRLISIGQRTIDPSIPKNVMSNSTFKFGMKMDNVSDFTPMFGTEADKLKKPYTAGVGLSMVQGQQGVATIKTLTPGGGDDDQILKLIRVMALEWVRRSMGVDDIINPPVGYNIPKSYNRDKFASESFDDLEKGRILLNGVIDEGYSMDEIGNAPVLKGIRGTSTTEEVDDDLYDMLSESYDESLDDVLTGMGDEVDEYMDEEVEIDIDDLINEVFGGETGSGAEEGMLGSDRDTFPDSSSIYSLVDDEEITDDNEDDIFGTDDEDAIFGTDDEDDIFGTDNEEDEIFSPEGGISNEVSNRTQRVKSSAEGISDVTSKKLVSEREMPEVHEPEPQASITPSRQSVESRARGVTKESVSGEQPRAQRKVRPQPRPKARPAKRKVVKKVVTRPKSPSTQGVQMDFGVTSSSSKQMSIKEYVINNGQRISVNNYAIPVSEIHELYTEKEVSRALSNFSILEDDGMYVTRI